MSNISINYKVKIELAKQEHIKECSERLFDSDFGKTYYPTLQTAFDILTKALKDDVVLIAKNDDLICGFIWFSKSNMFGKYPYLNLIFVFPDFRRQGVANALLVHYEESILKDTKSPRTNFFLVVQKKNIAAQDFYYKHGYRALCTFNGLFRKRLEEVFMCKEVHYSL